MKTAFEELAGLLGSIERSRTPLQESLDKFSRLIGSATLIIVAFVAVLGFFMVFLFLGESLCGVILALASTTLISMEFVKYFYRNKLRKSEF